MRDELMKMELVEIRNLFLAETKMLLTIIDTETPEGIRERKERIKLIDEVLEEKKKSLSEKKVKP